MLCDICGVNEASVHLTEIIDEQTTELHLCEQCAKEKGASMEHHFGLADLLAGLAAFGTELEGPPVVKTRCANCGMGYDDFMKMGRLGCYECYGAFRKNLEPLLKKIHGSVQHIGKSPIKLEKPFKDKTELALLKERLQKAIQLENFEEAAKLRDKIRDLENKNGAK